MFCKKCGNKIDIDSVYCNKCGEKISNSNKNDISLIKSLLTFEGRASYQKFQYLYLGGTFLLGLLGLVIVKILENSPILQIFSLIYIIIISIYLVIINTTLIVQRLHDLNLSGYYWWIIFALVLASKYIIPSIIPEENVIKICGLIVFLILVFLFFIPRTNGPNKYGDKP